MSSTHIILCGASGRMGARISALALEDPAFQLHSAVARPGSARLGELAAPAHADSARFQAPDQLAPGGDVVIDFSSPEGLPNAVKIAVSRKMPLLVGTTGLGEPARAMLRVAASSIAVLVAPNTSLGVATLAALVARAAQLLGPEFHCSIVEAHHVHKKDAPSGTALRLAGAARSGGAKINSDQIVAIRGGDVVGEHAVRFAGPGEYIELVHRATTRDLFARGALRAARWLVGKPAGEYSMEDTLAMPAR